MSIIAQIIEATLPEYRETHGLSLDQVKACDAILRCRSGELGYLQGACLSCGYIQLYPASCRNRHCPNCQSGAALRWVEQWRSKIPDVPTYHCVFTVPECLRLLFLFGRRKCFNALFVAARKAIERLCRKHPLLAGVSPGMIAMLHTWGSQLQFHPHLHVILCGAGYRQDGTWVQLPANKGWVGAVRALSRCFKGVLLEWLNGLLEANEPVFGLPHAQVASIVRRAALRPWRVFLQRSRCGPDRALAYLGRYAHRVGISEGRVLSFEGGMVKIAYRAHNEKVASHTCLMSGQEFLARFLQHVLPCGFRKIRAYGFLLRGGAPAEATTRVEGEGSGPLASATVPLCPHCLVPLMFVFLSNPGRMIKRCAHSPPLVGCKAC
jgi:hypothetical protein